jgi:hypothetical protein
MVVVPNPDLDPFASIKQDISAIAHSDMSVATNAKGERIFLVKSGGRIGLIADRIDLIQSTVQDFATQEIVSCLKSSDFRVTLEQKGDEKIISASDSKKNVVKVTVEKGKETICFDTRKIRRPKCDFMHQLIKAKLGEKATSSPGIDSPQRKHRREDNQIRVKR